ncbi:MAG TPA: hypothetical protein VF734_13315, partial [Pseudonocardiaceae bacterium]
MIAAVLTGGNDTAPSCSPVLDQLVTGDRAGGDTCPAWTCGRVIEEQFVLVSPQHPGDFGDASPEQPRP